MSGWLSRRLSFVEEAVHELYLQCDELDGETRCVRVELCLFDGVSGTFCANGLGDVFDRSANAFGDPPMRRLS